MLTLDTNDALSGSLYGAYSYPALGCRTCPQVCMSLITCKFSRRFLYQIKPQADLEPRFCWEIAYKLRPKICSIKQNVPAVRKYPFLFILEHVGHV
jgi:hypothetical protein